MTDPQFHRLQHNLSEDGQQRRIEILQLARRTASARRRRRAACRVFAVATVFAAAVLLSLRSRGPVQNSPSPAWVVGPPPQLDQTASIVAVPAHPLVAASRPAAHPLAPITVVRVETDPVLRTRLAIPAANVDVRHIDDAALLAELAQAGNSVGLAYMDGKATLLFCEKPGHRR